MPWMLLAALISSPIAQADFHPYELKEVYIDYRHQTSVGYDPVLQLTGDNNISLNNKLDLHINSKLFEVFYWENMLNSTSDQGQFRVIGWEYALGVQVFPWLRAGWYHHSQHLLDKFNVQHFPLENAIQIQIWLYQNNKPLALIN